MQKTAPTQDPQRQRILDAASEVFLECGFEQASTADIARRARVSKRELYINFADKQALLEAVVTAHESLLQVQIDSTLYSGEGIETVLQNSAKAIQGFLLSERFGKMMRLVVAASFQAPNLAKQFYDSGPHQGRQALARFLKAQMQAGALRRSNPTRAAEVFLDLVVGAHLTTAIVLGQADAASHKRANVRHAVKSFLKLYGPTK